ncbi:hypothetical protein Tco_0639651 [Tanacetum coccineum]
MGLLHHHLSFPLLVLLLYSRFIDGQRFLSVPVRLFPLFYYGRPYRTHPNGSRKLLTVRKRVGPFPTRRLAWRCVSHCSSDRHSLPDFTSDSSSSGSSLDSLSDISSGSFSYSLSDSSSVHSLGCDVSGQSHSGPSTKVASPRSAPLSTLYPPTTSESSLDSSSERLLDSSSPSPGPSRKRCRSPTTLVPSSTPVSRSISLAFADLLPRNRFGDSYSSEASGEEHIEIGTADAKTVADLGISDGVRTPTEDGLGVGVEVATSDIREDEEGFEAEVSARGTMEIAVDPLVTGGIYEPTGGDAPDLEEADQLVASGERASLADKVRSLRRENLRVRALLCIERDRFDSLYRHMALSLEEFHQIHRDRDDIWMRLRRLESLVERHLGFPLVPARFPIVPADPLSCTGGGRFSVILPTKGLICWSINHILLSLIQSEESLPTPELPWIQPLLILAWRRVSHHSSDRHSSPDFTSDSSSSGLSSDSSSDTSSGSSSGSLLDSSSVHLSGCDTSGQIHSGPSTRVSSPRFKYGEGVGALTEMGTSMDHDDAQRRLRRTMTNTHSGMTLTAVEEMISRRVAEALETREANRNIRLGNGNGKGGNDNSDGNGNERGNKNGNHNENDRDARPVST